MLNNLVASAILTGKVNSVVGWDATAADGALPGHRGRFSQSAFRRIVRRSTTLRSILAALRRTTASGRSPKWSRRSFLAARSRICGKPSSDARSYAVKFESDQPRCSELPAELDAQAGAIELYKAYQSVGMTADDMGTRYARLPHLASLQKQGRLGADLRWVQ